MKCHKCNQDSIKIKTGHIYCDICGLDIDCGDFCLDDAIYDLFLYNEQLGASYDLGREAYSDDKFYADNPYIDSTDIDQIRMKFSWWKGWEVERDKADLAGLSFLAEKLGKEVNNQESVIDTLMKEISDFRASYVSLKMQVLVLFRRKYWFGKSYDKDIAVIVDEHSKVPDK